MSYEAEALADGPAIYIRTNEVGTDTNGATWPDYSLNGLDATQVYAPLFGSGPTGTARGNPSVIETDADSREFYGWTNPNPPLEGTSQLIVGDDPLIQPDTDFTLVCHVRPEAGMYAAVPIFLVGKENSCAISFEFVAGGERIGGYCYDTAGTKWVVADTSFEFDLHIGESFFVALRRIGPSLSLFINRTLRGTTSITSGLGTAAGANFIVGHNSSLHFTQCRYADPRLYLTGLSADRLLAQYEAAFFNNPLAGRADLRMIATLDGDPDPTPPLLPFRHNWEAEIHESYSWLTDTMPAAQDYEQRVATRTRPLRTLEYDHYLYDKNLRRRFQAFIFQNQAGRVYLPIWTDKVLLTADAAAGATSLAFVSTYYDFDDDAFAVLYKDQDNYEIVQLDTVGASSSSLKAELENDWSKSTCYLVPIVRAYIDDGFQIARMTATLEETVAGYRVLAQDVPLSPRRNTAYEPRYTYKDIEVFDPAILGTNNFAEDVEIHTSHRAADPTSPQGIFSRIPQDTAPRQITSYKLFLSSRAAISRFLGWLWTRNGRQNSLWIPSRQSDFDAISRDTGEITVAGNDYTDYFATHPARRDLAYIYKNETMSFARVEGSSKTTGQETLDLDTSPTLTNLAMLSFLKLARLNEDIIDLVWHSDRLVEVTLNFIDLLTTPE